MPPLDWNRFEQLPGAADANFESLCRAVIRLQYGKYGEFRALSQQPGVEFHLLLRENAPIGNAGRWFGWQCRWYGLRSGVAIGTTRKKKILESIWKSEQALPELTDWVLWTRYPLTKSDQEWFKKIDTRLRLDMATSLDLEDLLCGPATLFRSTYFGELIFTPEALAEQCVLSTATIRTRWQPEVHQELDPERTIRRSLVEPTHWQELVEQAATLDSDASLIDSDSIDLNQSFVEALPRLTTQLRKHAAALRQIVTAIEAGDFEVLRQNLQTRRSNVSQDSRGLAHHLRAARHKSAISVSNALCTYRESVSFLDELMESIDTNFVAVIGDAGFGKTELSAQLASESQFRPAGILLHGRDLAAGQSLDDLAQTITLHGERIPGIEALVAAVAAAAERARRRLPIVIDGLNEAEDPRNWKPELTRLQQVLLRYPQVLFICTVRKEFAAEALPEEVKSVELNGFGHDLIKAVRRYFDHYKINATDFELPVEMLDHPLTLRIFCEVTNPKRITEVGVESMPGSLTSLFDAYVEQATKRIVELAPRTHRFYQQDVRTALIRLGLHLWSSMSRSIEQDTFRALLGDQHRPWNESLVRALEHEGILLRTKRGDGTANEFSVTYDALGGHLIADALLSEYGRSGFGDWLHSATTKDKLAHGHSSHPLASDIIKAFVGLVPRRHGSGQLWRIAPVWMSEGALRLAVNLEPESLDAETVEKLGLLVGMMTEVDQSFIWRLYQTRGADAHPLNAGFLDKALRPLNVAARDSVWTEWIRSNTESLESDVLRLESRWRQGNYRSGDALRLKWVMWILTTTIRNLRDLATRAVYWYGRHQAATLFRATIDSLSINDPYVSERTLAASYGVALAMTRTDTGFGADLGGFLGNLSDSMLGAEAAHSTSHYLSRKYVQGLFSFAARFYPDALPSSVPADRPLEFSPTAQVESLPEGDARSLEVSQTLEMDFKNYTIGRLFDDRRNYDMSHAGHKEAVAAILGEVRALGWRKDGIGAVDKRIVQHSSRIERPEIERYGKKYSRIGFHNYAGQLCDEGRLTSEDYSDVDLDPSFPKSLPRDSLPLPNWVSSASLGEQQWVSSAEIAIPTELFYREEFQGAPGPWVAVAGYFSQDEDELGRHVFGFLTALLVAPSHRDVFLSLLTKTKRPGNLHLTDLPGDHYTFAGEIPWSSDFAKPYKGEKLTDAYVSNVDLPGASSFEVERLAHSYEWEGYHSAVNDAGSAPIPSRLFSDTFNLIGIPQSFDQLSPDGRLASISRRVSEGFDGWLLYLREDLLAAYAGDRCLLSYAWGERNLHLHTREAPDWLRSVFDLGADVWRVMGLNEDFL